MFLLQLNQSPPIVIGGSVWATQNVIKRPLDIILVLLKMRVFKPTKSQLPPSQSNRTRGIGRKTPQDIVLFETLLPQDMGVGKELE